METLIALNRERLRRQLVDQSLKRWWVAEYAGIHKTTLRRWISGDIRRVRPDHLARVADLLGIPRDALVERGTGPEPRSC